MKGTMVVFSFLPLLCAGCMAAVPALIGSVGAAAYCYYREKAEGVYRLPVEQAYPVAIRTLKALNLKIADIEVGSQNRIISAEVPDDGSRDVIFTLETAGPGLTRATIRAVDHNVIPDRACGKMVLVEVFTDEIKQSRPGENNKSIVMGRR